MIGMVLAGLVWGGLLQDAGGAAGVQDGPPHWVCVSNERGGTVSVIDSRTGSVAATIPVGKRPRGVHASPDGAVLYVAVSGVPIVGPTKLDGQGKPIEPEIDDKDVDHEADGIAVVDLKTMRVLRKLPAGSDPEQFAVSADGKTLYVANEDVGTASVVDATTGAVRDIVRVKPEPEGVGLSPEGAWVVVTCETNGNVVRFEAAPAEGAKRRVEELAIGGRPRSVVFAADGARAFVPSETTGQMFVLDMKAWAVERSVKLEDGARPMGTALSPDGARLYVTTGRGGTLCVLATRDLGTLGRVKVGTRPWGVAVSPDGTRVYVANGPSNDVSIVDAATLKEVGRVACGESPWGVTVVPNRMTRTAR